MNIKDNDVSCSLEVCSYTSHHSCSSFIAALKLPLTSFRMLSLNGFKVTAGQRLAPQRVSCYRGHRQQRDQIFKFTQLSLYLPCLLIFYLKFVPSFPSLFFVLFFPSSCPFHIHSSFLPLFATEFHLFLSPALSLPPT